MTCITEEMDDSRLRRRADRRRRPPRGLQPRSYGRENGQPLLALRIEQNSEIVCDSVAPRRHQADEETLTS
jgi:hypothetical protein